MSRVMLINGQHAEELRVAVVDGGVLESFQIEVAESGQERGNIYRGIVANIEPSLDAAFIDYGKEKHGFLTSHDVVRQAYHRSSADEGRRPAIGDVLEKGRSVLVQVARDAVGTKGSALTTNISLPGRFLVLTPFDASSGLSRKIEDEALRKALKEKAKSFALPEGHGYIIRTSAADQTKTALKADLAASLRLWKQVQGEFKRGKGSRLLYDDQDLIVQALRDYLDTGIEEVLIDDETLLERATEYIKATMPRSKIKISRYPGRVPLFSRYNLEPQIDSIYKRTVPLAGGGSIVVDHTEALTAIDVNSGKNTRGATQEETAYRTNLEAAEEVARQLRLRNIGGLVVVDFIDMRSRRHRAAVEKTQRDAMKRDKSRVGVGRISSNGLLEINRQRMRSALVQRMHRTCPTCDGVGLLATPELLGLRLLRRIEARAATGRLRKVRIGLHPELADAIQNQRRRQLVAFESEFGIELEIVAAPHLHRSDEEIDWIAREPADQADAKPSRHEGGSRRSRGASKPTRPLAAHETREAQAASADNPAAAQAEGGEPQTQASSGDDSSSAGEGNGQRSRRRRRRRRRRRGPLNGAVSEAVPGQALSETPTDVEGVTALSGRSGDPGASPAADAVDDDAVTREIRQVAEPTGLQSTGLQRTPTQVEIVLSQDQSVAADAPAPSSQGGNGQQSASGSEEVAAPTGRRRTRRRGGSRRRGAAKASAEAASEGSPGATASAAAPAVPEDAARAASGSPDGAAVAEARPEATSKAAAASPAPEDLNARGAPEGETPAAPTTTEEVSKPAPRARRTRRRPAARKTAKPKDDVAKPAAKATKPAEDAAKPAAKATKQAEDAPKPAAKATKPAEDAAKPAAKATKPSEDAKATKQRKPADSAPKPRRRAPRKKASKAKTKAKASSEGSDE